MTGRSIFIVLGWLSTLSCVTSPKGASEEEALWPADRVRVEEKPMEKELVAADVMIEKELLYDQFTANFSLFSDAVLFEPLIFVDRTHQNITTLENRDKLSWLVRSMPPAITVSIAHLMPKRLL